MTVKKHFHHCCMFNAISTLQTCSKSFLTFSLLKLCFHFRSKTSSKWPFPQQQSQLYFDKTDRTAAQYRNHKPHCKKKFVHYTLSANEQQQQLQRDLLAWEERVISISFGRERMWPQKATLGNSCPSFTRGRFTFWGMKSPGQAPSRDMRTVFHILSYQVFGPGQ